jgi:hypothetical protein
MTAFAADFAFANQIPQPKFLRTIVCPYSADQVPFSLNDARNVTPPAANTHRAAGTLTGGHRSNQISCSHYSAAFATVFQNCACGTECTKTNFTQPPSKNTPASCPLLLYSAYPVSARGREAAEARGARHRMASLPYYALGDDADNHEHHCRIQPAFRLLSLARETKGRPK